VNRDGGFIEEKGDTAPLAICLAALRAFAPRVDRSQHLG